MYCQRRLRNREEAEDATQVTFLKALTGLRNGAVPQVENAWLFTIAKRVVLTRLEVTNRLRAIETKAEVDAVAENRGDALGRAEMDELWKAVEALPETARRAFLMREWQGMQYDEIADALGLDRSHVGVMLHRARRRVVATVHTSRGRVRALLNVSSLSGLVRRVADLFSGNASHLLLAATTMASPVGALGLPSAHPTSTAQRVVSANAVSGIGAGGSAPASMLASLESPRPFIVLQSSVAQRHGVSPSVDEPSSLPARPGAAPGGRAVLPGGGVEPGGGTSATATASGRAEVLPVADTVPVPIPVPAAGTATGTPSPKSKDGSKGKSGSKAAAPPGRSAAKTQEPPAKVPPTTKAHGAARASANAASPAGAAKNDGQNGSSGIEAWRKSRGPSTEHGAQAGPAGRNADPLAGDAYPGLGNGNKGNGNDGHNGNSGKPGAASPTAGPGQAGQEHGNSHAPAEPGKQQAPVDPASSTDAGLGHGNGVGPSDAAHGAGRVIAGAAADALPAVPGDSSHAPENAAASSGPKAGPGNDKGADTSAVDSPSNTTPPDLSNGPVAADPAPGNGHASPGQGHAADAPAADVVSEVLVVAPVPVELGVQDAPVDPVAVPVVAAEAAPGNGHGASGKGNGADAAVVIEAVVVPVIVPVVVPVVADAAPGNGHASSPGNGHAVDPVAPDATAPVVAPAAPAPVPVPTASSDASAVSPAPAQLLATSVPPEVTAPAPYPAASTPAAPPATPVAPAKKPPKK
jgi:RNA polymerase sigma factor (sigma-70 family)